MGGSPFVVASSPRVPGAAAPAGAARPGHPWSSRRGVTSACRGCFSRFFCPPGGATGRRPRAAPAGASRRAPPRAAAGRRAGGPEPVGFEHARPARPPLGVGRGLLGGDFLGAHWLLLISTASTCRPLARTAGRPAPPPFTSGSPD